MKKLLFLIAFAAVFGISAAAAGITDIKGHEFEKEITVLNALDIVSGDENYEFHPDATVKRSEATKLMVEAFSALGSSCTKTETEFSDVPVQHWASGYIQAASDLALITGVGGGNFAPDDEITLDQACTIIVRALGYELFAESVGGYPSGYMKYANDLDITDRIDLSDYKRYITKGDLAYMIAVALEAPMADYRLVGGDFVPFIMQGRGLSYLCPLIKYHHAYYVNGMITNTSRSSSSLRSGYVELKINYARRLGTEYVTAPRTLICGVVDGDAVYDLLYMRGEFILKETNDDEYTVVMIIL